MNTRKLLSWDNGKGSADTSIDEDVELSATDEQLLHSSALPDPNSVEGFELRAAEEAAWEARTESSNR